MNSTTEQRVIQPYLFFNGSCEQAVQFYRMALGAEIQFMMRYKESPEPLKPGLVQAGFENKVMHTSFRVGQTVVMAADDCTGKTTGFQGFNLALSVPNEGEANRLFAALADGGQVRLPLARTFWSPCFGMVADRFGVGWMVSVPAPPHG
jgi:PhnB protein